MNCINCNIEMEEEELSGIFEPYELLFTCSKCGRKELDVEGLGIEVIEEGENGKA